MSMPYGSVANLETLSCVQPLNMANGNSLIQPQQPNAQTSSSAVATTAQQQIQQQYANYYGQASNRYSSQPSVSPSASSSPMGTTSLNQFYRSVLDQLQTARTAVLQQSQNPSTKIVANIQQTVTTGAAPGGSCAHAERCEGGSICMHPMNVCLCPGELESQNGQCVPSYQKAISGIAKVGIGARCNQYNTFCDFESNCVNGYCKCLLPMVEQAGKCVQPTIRKESVCDQQVPVCVCPAGTSLENGWCIQPTRPPPNPPAPATTNLITEHTANGNYKPELRESGSAYVTGGGYIPPSSPPASTETFSKQNPIKKPAVHVGNAHKQQSAVVTVIFPGQKGCDNDLQCTTAYAGTRCINRQCVCPPGSRLLSKLAYQRMPGQESSATSPIPSPPVPASPIAVTTEFVIASSANYSPKQCVARPDSMPISNHQTTVCIQDRMPTNFLCLDNRCECPPERVRHNSECVSVLPLDSTLEDLNKEEGLREAPVLRQTLEHRTNFSTIAMLKNAHIRPYEEIPSFGQLTSNQVMQDTEKRRRKRDSWSRTSMVKHNGEQQHMQPAQSSHSNTPYRSINSECMGADRALVWSICRNSMCRCVDGS
uniref:EB domain-containing protein n=1 Tax=Ditylenchus dipsaci TaxID=166011 RepID=A0A915EHI3_9BILA